MRTISGVLDIHNDVGVSLKLLIHKLNNPQAPTPPVIKSRETLFPKTYFKDIDKPAPLISSLFSSSLFIFNLIVFEWWPPWILILFLIPIGKVEAIFFPADTGCNLFIFSSSNFWLWICNSFSILVCSFSNAEIPDSLFFILLSNSLIFSEPLTK